MILKIGKVTGFNQWCAIIILSLSHFVKVTFSSLQLSIVIEDFNAQFLFLLLCNIISLVIGQKIFFVVLGFRRNRFKSNFRNFTYFTNFTVLCKFTTFGK